MGTIALIACAAALLSAAAFGADRTGLILLVLGGAAAALAALALLHRNRRVGLEGIRRFAERARQPDGGDAPRVDERGDRAWFATARALNELASEDFERRQSDQSTRDRIDSVIGAIEEAFLVVSGDERILFANDRLGELFGAPGKVLGRPVLEVVRERRVIEALESAARGEARDGEIEIDGATPRQLRFRAYPYRTDEGSTGAVALFHDITELRRAEMARRDFLANASHEIKTPLSAVRGYAEILSDRGASDPTSKRSIDAILSNAKRLTALVEDLLELSRIESGSFEIEARTFNASEVARALLRDFEARARSANISLELETEEPTQLRADRRAFEQVLTNLVDNAIKYTPAGGRVSVAIAPAETPERLRVEVRDNGPGIAPRHRDRVFERFYRIDPGRSRSLGGTGLGLAIVKHLVQGMGGEIGLDSEPGVGSCFWFELSRPS